MKSVRNVFERVIGVENLKYLEENNRIGYNSWTSDLVVMQFLMDDFLGDRITFQEIEYEISKELFLSQDGSGIVSYGFETFEDLVGHIKSIRELLIENGFKVIDLPELP